jgi:hypothetical protein
MPNNVSFSSTPGFTAGSSQPIIREWYLPGVFQQFSSVNSNATPPRLQIVGYIKDYTRSSFARSHSDFKVRVRVVQDVDALSLIVPFAGDAVDGLFRDITDPTDLEVLEDISFAAVSILPAGIYEATYIWEVHATNLTTSNVEIIDTRSVPVFLLRMGETGNVITPNKVQLVYLKNTGSLNTQTLNVVAVSRDNSADWSVTAPAASFNITVPNSVIVPGTSPIYNTSGDNSISIAAASSWATFNAGRYDRIVPVNFEWANRVSGFEVTVSVFDAPGILTSADSLSFVSVVPENAPAQVLEITGTASFTITGPPWLQLSASSGQNVLDLIVEPIDVANFSGGSFTGDIVITMGAIVKTVSVTFTVLDQLSYSFSTDLLNFTLDADTLQVSGFNEDRYMKVITSGYVYNADDVRERIFHEAIIPFLNSKAVYQPGYIIDQFIPNYYVLDGHAVDNFTQPRVERYPNAASIRFNIQVINRLTGVIELNRSLNDILFIRGYLPSASLNVPGAPLSLSVNVARIDSRGRYIFNAYDNAPSQVELYKNETLQDVFVMGGSDAPAGRIVIMGSDYLLGDRIELRQTHTVDGAAVTVSDYVIIYPDQEHSCHISYTTDYNTIEMIQLCGSLSASIGYDRRTNLLVKNRVELSKHVDVIKKTELLINTGYIPRDQIPMIDRLNSALRTWLIYDGLDPIEISISTPDMVSYDAQRFLYDYEIKCVTNPDNDAQIHTF